MTSETIRRAPIYSLWEHRRTGRTVMADSNRITAAGVRQVRIKHEGRSRWIDLDRLVQDYRMDDDV